MNKIAKKLTDLIGNTPLLELSAYNKANSIEATIIAKLEYFNPAGSVKDRVAAAMVKDAEDRGILQKGGTIIEPTSGNTGIGLALVSAANGYKLILTMPETMSMERRSLLKALGAEIVLTPGTEGMKGAIARSEELKKEIEGSVILGQFVNMANPTVHYHTTAQEIWRDTDGDVDVIVAGVGTGGTVSGIGKRLKELNPNIVIVAVEPTDSPVISEGRSGAHKIQGIGAGFIPATFNGDIVDRVVTVGNDEAIMASRKVAQSEGLLVGISSGAALFAATKLSQEEQFKGKKFVVILPDSGERYLSTVLYDNENYPL